MTTPPPSEGAQLAFLANVQRVLEEGRFTATYKFALLIALTDLAVERGHDTGEALALPVEAIAEKFVEMYWGHTREFRGAILHQNPGANIALLGYLQAVQRDAPLLGSARRTPHWRPLLRQVARLVRTMPLFKLQALRGDERLIFLYEERIQDGAIVLLPGACYCLRRFSGLIRALSRNAWVEEIRQFGPNQMAVAASDSLPEFLFGTERINLGDVNAALLPLQNGRCFYCREAMHHGSHVDHFIPFALYPAHLAHNFVLAHASCNGDKSSLLADLRHLEAWVDRNNRHGAEIAGALRSSRIAVDADSTTGIARWAYRRAADTRALLWSRRGVANPCPRDATFPF